MTHATKLWLVAAVLGMSTTVGCGDRPQPTDEPATKAPTEEATTAIDLVPANLWLEIAGEDAGTVAVDLKYRLRDGQMRPRMMELHVAYSEGLAYDRSQPLAALTAAGKRLVVQDRGGVLRTVVFASTNLDRLDSGPLVRFHFRRTSGPGTVLIERRSSMFAPADANGGLVLGGSLDVGGAR